ncbi:MAG: hypothetical protein Q4G25_15405 [Paracoccus sp. (in: a-proteobacteria)]|nr:hypothetical protein [Paracoccus sp. (in: a-proteobacteria)]
MRLALMLTVSLSALPGPLLAGESCADTLAQMDHVFSGMFLREADSVIVVNSFPLFASKERLVYVSCLVAEDEASSPCALSVMERHGSLLRPAARFGLAGCAETDGWSPDCPDFTAEGFTQGNASKLAGGLRADAARICAPFETRPVARLVPVPTGDAPPAGLDTGTFFEITPTCAGLAPAARAGCAALPETPDQPAAGFFAARSGGGEIVCAVTAEGEISVCGDG